MVNTRGKRGTASYASDEGGTSQPIEEPNEDDQLEDNVEVFAQEADDKGVKNFMSQEESEKVMEVGNNDGNILTERDEENKADPAQNISDDDKAENQGLMLDAEEDVRAVDNVGNVGDKDEASDEDSGNEEDDVRGDKALAEEHKADEVGSDKAIEVVKGAEKEVKAKEYTRETQVNCDQRDSKEIGKKRKAKAKEGRMKAKVKEAEKGANVKKDGKELNDNRNDNLVEGLKNDKDSGKNRKNKVRLGMSNKVDPKDQSESSKKGKKKKKNESMGMIFMCSSKTKNDCYKYSVLGLPESKKDVVEKIYTGMRLFLYDIKLKLLYGIYKAAGPGGYNIEPKAFKSKFPAQVRFTLLKDCLPLSEEKFKKVIKENYFTETKFDCQLNAAQVKKLCELFAISSKGHLPQKSGVSVKSKKKLHPERSKRRLFEDQHPPPMDHPRPHKRPRKAVVDSPLHYQAPLGYIHEHNKSDMDAHLRIPYPYREPPTPAVIRRETFVDPYLDYDSYYPSRRALYLDRRQPYVDRRPPPLYSDPYTVGRGAHELYREGRDHLYMERLDLSRDTSAYAVGAYRRAPLLSDSRDGLHLGSMYRPDFGGQDSFVSTRQLPPSDPIYSREYLSQASLPREYHL